MAEENKAVKSVVPEVVVPEVKVVEPTPVSLKDDDIVEVIVRGETVRKSWKDARAGVQMQEDYTRDKQALKKNAEELEKYWTDVRGTEAALKAKEEMINRVLGGKPTESKKSLDDLPADEVLTAAQAREYFRSEREKLTSEFDGKLNEHLKNSEQRTTIAKWEELTDKTVDSLTKEHPILANIEDLNIVLRRAAAKGKPGSEKEMVSMMVEAGQKMAKKLRESFVEEKKQEAITKEKLRTRGPESTSGVPQFKVPEGKSFIKGRKIDWDELENTAVAALEHRDD